MEACLASGGFELAKRASNAEVIPTSVLGLKWNPRTDMLQFKAREMAEICDVTKRIVSSDAAHLYDPNGYATPVLIMAKVLLQDLWRTGFDWDDRVDDVTMQK